MKTRVKVVVGKSPEDLEGQVNEVLKDLENVVNVSVSGLAATITYIDKTKTLNEVK